MYNKFISIVYFSVLSLRQWQAVTVE